LTEKTPSSIDFMKNGSPGGSPSQKEAIRRNLWAYPKLKGRTTNREGEKRKGENWEGEPPGEPAFFHLKYRTRPEGRKTEGRKLGGRTSW
jgi:hypothetical protein